MKNTIYYEPWAFYLDMATGAIRIAASKLKAERRIGKKLDLLMMPESFKQAARFWIEKSRTTPGPKLP